MLNLINAIFSITIGNFNTTSWKLMFNISSPFDQTDAFSWFIRWFIEICMGVTYSLTIVYITSYFVACCFYINAMCEHFDFLMCSIGKNTEKDNISNGSETQHEGVNRRRERIQMNYQYIKPFTEVIKCHVNIFEWVEWIYYCKLAFSQFFFFFN